MSALAASAAVNPSVAADAAEVGPVELHHDRVAEQVPAIVPTEIEHVGPPANLEARVVCQPPTRKRELIDQPCAARCGLHEFLDSFLGSGGQFRDQRPRFPGLLVLELVVDPVDLLLHRIGVRIFRPPGLPLAINRGLHLAVLGLRPGTEPARRHVDLGLELSDRFSREKYKFCTSCSMCDCVQAGLLEAPGPTAVQWTLVHYSCSPTAWPA